MAIISARITQSLWTYQHQLQEEIYAEADPYAAGHFCNSDENVASNGQ